MATHRRDWQHKQIFITTYLTQDAQLIAIIINMTPRRWAQKRDLTRDHPQNNPQNERKIKITYIGRPHDCIVKYNTNGMSDTSKGGHVGC